MLNLNKISSSKSAQIKKTLITDWLIDLHLGTPDDSVSYIFNFKASFEFLVFLLNHQKMANLIKKKKPRKQLMSSFPIKQVLEYRKSH